MRLRGLQVGGFKTLAEAIVHRLQKAACLGGPTLVMLQACKACRCSQLPRQRALPARPIERLQEVLFGRRRGLRCTIAQDEFTLDAHELGDAPALLDALGPCERLVDYRERFGSFTVATEGVCHLGAKWGEEQAEGVEWDACERDAHKLQPGANVATLDEQHASKASTHKAPQLQRVLGRKLQERLHVALR